MDDKQIAKLLERYLDGTCTPEEAASIRAWYEREGDGRAFLDSLTEGKRLHLKNEILNEVIYRTQNPKPAYTGLSRYLWMKVSAAAVVLVMIRIVYSVYFSTPTNTTTALAEKRIYNQSKNIVRQMLPDSSVVWLNPGASVTFPERFDGRSRQIFMDGECFFEVTKNPKRPFIIRSQHLVTKVWGTSFKVIDHADAASAKVSVATGKVSVSLRGSKGDRSGTTLHHEEVLLNPTDEATFNKTLHNLNTGRRTDVSELDRYKHLNMAFENATLKNMASTLSRSFKVKIQIGNEELANRTMDADLTELNLPEVLEVLKSSMPLSYEISGDLILLKPVN